MEVRSAREGELDAVARVWHSVWYETHAALMPPALHRLRTLESFRERLGHLLPDVRVAGPEGAPVGFCIIRGEELYQLWVLPEARGTGAAAALLDDGEARLAANGVRLAYLGCALGNERAARFYEKRGWRRAGRVTDYVDTAEGPFPLDVWRYEKALTFR